jgi:hypothetical protein
MSIYMVGEVSRYDNYGVYVNVLDIQVDVYNNIITMIYIITCV